MTDSDGASPSDISSLVRALRASDLGTGLTQEAADALELVSKERDQQERFKWAANERVESLQRANSDLEEIFKREHGWFKGEQEMRKAAERRADRLRKAVVWLKGALHDESPEHTDSHDDCRVWECIRARTVLEETTP